MHICQKFKFQSDSSKARKTRQRCMFLQPLEHKTCLSDQNWSLRQKSLLHSAHFSEIQAQNWPNFQKARTNTRHNGEPLEIFLTSPSSRRLFLSSSSSDSKSLCPRLCCPTRTRGLPRRPLFRGATRGPQRRRFVHAGLRLRKLQTFGTTWALSRGRRPVFAVIFVLTLNCFVSVAPSVVRQRCFLSATQRSQHTKPSNGAALVCPGP